MYESLLKFPLKCLNKLGLLAPNSMESKIIATCSLLANSFLTVTAVLQFFYVQGDTFAIIDNCEGVFGYMQMNLKLIFLIVNKNKVLNLRRLTESFWTSGDCLGYVRKEVGAIRSEGLTSQKLFYYAAQFTLLVTIFFTYLLGKPLPLGTWKMVEYDKLYKAVYVVYSLYLFIGVTVCSALDGLFLGFCYEIVIQFRIFCNHLEQMNVENIETEQDLRNRCDQFKKYIEHHKFLIRFVKEMQNCFSWAFMIQYITTAPLICSEFYAAFESKNLLLAFRYGVSTLLITTTILIYCIGAQYVTQEVLTVSDAAYNSNWYSKHFNQLKRSTLLMIQQGQQEVRFTACGLINMNIATIVTTLQFAIFATTFLRSLDK